jgi:tripartite-type tricarboxylate transporter receptor subunit TctC
MRSLVALLATAWLVLGNTALAQSNTEFPNRAVRLVVPFPPGGPTDVCARIVGQKLSELWGQPVVIENRPGADTAIGAQVVARAEPNGHTLLVAVDSTLTVNPLIRTDLPYNPSEDFAPVALLFKNTTLLTVKSDGPATVKELIAKARANPGKLNYGAGIPANRLAASLFIERAGIDVQYIPFKGGSDLVTGLLNRSLDFAVDSAAASLPAIQAGNLRALAKISTTVSLPSLPDLPSFSVAADMPLLEDITSWGALVAPRATPQETWQRRNWRSHVDPRRVGCILVSRAAPLAKRDRRRKNQAQLRRHRRAWRSTSETAPPFSE